MKGFLFLFGFLAALSPYSLFASLNPQDRPKVLLTEIKWENDFRKILVPALVGAKIQSTVTAETEGHVVDIRKPLGSLVKAGETILSLENKDPGFTFAKVPVKAPISGVLGQILVSQMSRVARGDKLFSVINPHSLKVSAELVRDDVTLLHPGIKGNFREGSKTYNVRVVGVSPLVDPRTGTAPAELEFLVGTGTPSSLPAIGTIGQISFEIPLGRVILIPETSLFYQEGKPLIRVLKGADQVEKRAITLGEQREDLFVVKSGLSTGEKIVVRSERPIKDGESVQVENSGSGSREKK